MATTTQQTQKRDWTLFRYHFAHSTYISKGWNWFLELSGKLAAPILLTSVLYAGLKLAKPDFVTMYLSGFDVFISVAQLLALDMGGLGLLAIAKHAARGGDSEGAKRAKRVAFAMFALMMITLSLSSVASAFGWHEQEYAWVVGLLLIARAILCEVLAAVPRLAQQLSSSEQSLQGQLHDLLTEVSHRNGSVEEVRMELPKRTSQNSKSEGSHATETRPNGNTIQLVPNVSGTGDTAKGFDKGKFVVACLRNDPEMKGSDIQRRAFEQFGQHISASYISETKAAFRREQSA